MCSTIFSNFGVTLDCEQYLNTLRTALHNFSGASIL